MHQRRPSFAFATKGSIAARLIRPCSEYTRRWDVVGTTHASLYGSQYIDAIVDCDQSINSARASSSRSRSRSIMLHEPLPPFTTVDVGHGVQGRHRLRCVAGSGLSSCAAPSISFERDSSGALVRDADGKVKGGIRLAQFTAPIADQVAPTEPHSPARCPATTATTRRKNSRACMAAMATTLSRSPRR